MPISKYNPDGTVDIYNSKTGEVRRGVKPQDLASISPKLVGEYEAGQAPTEQLARKEAEQKLTSMTDESPNKEKKDLLNLITQISNSNLAPNTGTLKIRENVPWATEAKYTKALIDQLQGKLSLEGREQLKGSGAISDFEFKVLQEAASALRPDLREEDFRKELEKLAQGLGGNLEKQKVAPVSQTTPESIVQSIEGNPIINMLLGRGLRVAKDVGVGMAAQSADGQALQQSREGSFEMIQRLQEAADKTQDVEQKKKLLALAQTMAGDVSQSSSNEAGQYSEGVGANPFLRGLGVGTDVASTTGLVTSLPGIIKNIPSGVKSVTNAIKSKTVSGALTNRASAASSNISTFKGKDFINVIDDYVENDPTAKKIGQTITEGLSKKTMTSEQLLKQLEVWNKAYSAAGKVGKSGKAGIYNALAQEARRQLELYAPKVLDAQRGLAGAYQIKGILDVLSPKNLARTGVGAASTAAVYELLRRMGIFGGQSNQSSQ